MMNERGPSAGSIAAGIICALALYVLSFGPVAGLVNRGLLPSEVGWVYAPLAFILDRIPPVRAVAVHYISMFS